MRERCSRGDAWRLTSAIKPTPFTRYGRFIYFPARSREEGTQEKRDYARSVNCSRREVTLEMKKQQARQMLLEDNDRSSSSVARVVGLSTHTVIAVREEMGLPVQSIQNQGNIQKVEGPDLSFLEKPDWKSYHRLEALEHLQKLGEEEKKIICALMNERERSPKDALAMLETAA